MHPRFWVVFSAFSIGSVAYLYVAHHDAGQPSKDRLVSR